MAESGQVAFRNRSVSQSRFAMVPRAEIPRSAFRIEHTHKTTFNLSRLIPVYVEEVLPGDSFRVNMTAFARLATPVFPVMDNFKLASFFFFVPNRLVWKNWAKFMGEKVGNPGEDVDYLVPVVEPDGLPLTGGLFDYMGIPVGNLTSVADLRINALPFRAYNLIYNDWFRDENLQPIAVAFGLDDMGDGPDTVIAAYAPHYRGKRHDYFTSCLPWPQKGDPVTLPLGTRAPVRGIGTFAETKNAVGGGSFYESDGIHTYDEYMADANPAGTYIALQLRSSDPAGTWWPDVYADLSEATSATINALRQAFAVQKLLERDARGGSRYTELLLSHFGVSPQDARLQRPEYIGGGQSDVLVSPIAQTSATDPENSPLGSLGAVGTSVARHGFSYSAAEHGFIIGIVSVVADLTYQQGLHRMWSRETRYDYYWPAFAHLGEQAVLRKEIYCTGVPANDDVVFGYQERWSEYRYHPSRISGLFRSTVAGNIDEWHMAEQFLTPPTLSATFIADTSYATFVRVAAAGTESSLQQVLFDSLFDSTIVRAMPTYSVPGLADRF